MTVQTDRRLAERTASIQRLSFFAATCECVKVSTFYSCLMAALKRPVEECNIIFFVPLMEPSNYVQSIDTLTGGKLIHYVANCRLRLGHLLRFAYETES